MTATPNSSESNLPGPQAGAHASSASDSGVKTRVYRLRWWPAAVLLGLGIIALGLARWVIFPDDGTHQVFFLLGVLSFWTLTLSLWWVFASGLRWRDKGLGFVAVVAMIAVARQIIRIDGFTGEMLPRLAWAWSPTPEKRAAMFREQAQANKGKSAVEKLTQTATGGKQSPDSAMTSTADGQTKADPTEDVASGDATAAVTQGSSKDDRPRFLLTEGDSPVFRGLGMDGVVDGRGLRFDWTESDRPRSLFKLVVGPAWSGFAVVGNRCYTQEQRDQDEVVVCYDFTTGAELWTYRQQARFDKAPSGLGPRATPTVAGGRVFAIGATGLACCLDWLTGDELWKTSVIEDPVTQNLEWGVSVSPVVLDDHVLFLAGAGGAAAEGRHSLRAYHVETGRLMWTANAESASYCTPQLAELGGVRQLLLFDAFGLKGLDPISGKELWKFAWSNGPRINVAQPIVVDAKQVLIGTGYGTGTTLLAIAAEAEKWNVTQVWSSKRLKPKFNGLVRRGEYIYGLDEGVLTCLDLATGKATWKSGRYGYGQLLLAGETLIVLSEGGDVVCVPADPKQWQEIGRFHALSGTTWNQSVLAHGRLLIRSNEEAECFDLRGAPASSSTVN